MTRIKKHKFAGFEIILYVLSDVHLTSICVHFITIRVHPVCVWANPTSEGTPGSGLAVLALKPGLPECMDVQCHRRALAPAATECRFVQVLGSQNLKS